MQQGLGLALSREVIGLFCGYKHMADLPILFVKPSCHVYSRVQME